MNKAVSTSSACYHCGDPCPDNAVTIDDKFFCCHGCKTVFELLSTHRLGKYYEIDQTPGTAPKAELIESAYAYLDDREVIDKLLDFSDQERAIVTFRLPQIHCSSCVWLLERLHKFNQGINSSRVDFQKQKATLIYDPRTTSLRVVVELLKSIGYEPAINLSDLSESTSEQEHSREAEKRVMRSLYGRLAVAGFCFGNVMLFSFPEYFAINRVLESEFAVFFDYMNLFLALPVLLYSSWPFFSSAGHGLKGRMINMDLPITLGIVTLFIRSTVEILSYGNAGFFDSFTGLVFFLLIGRVYQRKTYHALSFDRDYRSYFPVSVTVRNDQEITTIPVTRLKAGDTIIVRNRELIPADAILLKGQASIDYSFVTGESKPVTLDPGTRVFAGGRQLGPAVEMTVVKEVSQSYLTQLWNKDANQESRSEESKSLADSMSRYFTPAVLSISAITAVVWSLIDPSRAVDAATAVLIVACPCALALSEPFTLGTAVRVMGHNRLFLKSSRVVETMAQIKAIVFDKTGTLTPSDISQVNFVGDQLTPEQLALVGSLAAQSAHPLSRRISGELGERKRHSVESFKEQPGAGIAGKISGHKVKLGSSSWTGADKQNPNDQSRSDQHASVHLSIDDDYLGRFELPQQYRPGIHGLVASLKPSYGLTVLSGDQATQEVSVREIFGPTAELKFNQSPFDKLQFVRGEQSQAREVLMIGDGLNDAGALREARVGLAVAETSSSFTPGCDGILDSESLPKLPAFLSLAHKSLRIIKLSYLISIAYNLVGLTFAAQAVLSPLLAAVLMPASSVSVVLFSTLATRVAGRQAGLR